MRHSRLPYPAELPGSAQSSGAGSGSFNPSWLQSNWWIDWILGNDNNPGTQSAPVKTYTGGIRPRWGTDQPILPQTTTLHVASPQPVGAEHAIPSPVLIDGSNFVIVGSLQPVTTFTAGAVTPQSIGSPGQLLTMSGLPSGATPGQLIQRVSDGSLAIIDSISAGTAILTQPFTLATYTTITAEPSVANGNKVNTWATGQAFEIVTAPTFNLVQALVYGGDSNSVASTPTEWVQFITIPDITGTPGTSSFLGKSFGPGQTFSGCVFDAFPTLDGVDTVFGTFAIGCWSPGGAIIYDTFWYGGACNTNLTFETGVVKGVIDGSCILHGLVEFEEIYSVTGEVYLDSTARLIHGASVFMEVGTADPVAHPGGVVWGPGSLDQEGPNSGYEIVNTSSGATFANTFLVSAITLNAQTTGTSYASGVFTDGVTINATNLAAHGGLQNPRTGCRYVQTTSAS